MDDILEIHIIQKTSEIPLNKPNFGYTERMEITTELIKNQDLLAILWQRIKGKNKATNRKGNYRHSLSNRPF